MKIITIILIAVSLSMDAFSLALIYGTQAISKKGKILLSIIVGLYHFIMPLIGLSIGLFVTDKIIINTNILVGIILSLIAIEMIISSFKEKEEEFLLSIPGYLLFGLSVSIDNYRNRFSRYNRQICNIRFNIFCNKFNIYIFRIKSR